MTSKRILAAVTGLLTTYYSVYAEQRYKSETGEATGEIVYHASAIASFLLRNSLTAPLPPGWWRSLAASALTHHA